MTSAALTIFLAWIGGGVISGVTGAGSVIIALPLMLLVLPTSQAVLLSTLIGIYGVFQIAWIYRRSAVWNDIRDLVIGAVPGCIIGVLVLASATMPVLQVMIAAMLFFFVLIRLLGARHIPKLPDSKTAGFAAGLACGFSSSALSMAGAPLAIYVLLKDWPPERTRGNVSAFFLFSNLMSITAQASSGMYSADMLPMVIIGMAGCLLGQIFGVRLGRHIDKNVFQNLFLLMVAASAAILLYRSIQ